MKSFFMLAILTSHSSSAPPSPCPSAARDKVSPRRMPCIFLEAWCVCAGRDGQSFFPLSCSHPNNLVVFDFDAHFHAFFKPVRSIHTINAQLLISSKQTEYPRIRQTVCDVKLIGGFLK